MIGRRLVLASAGVLGLAAATWVSLLALILTSAFQSPNPDPGLDGDPCCPHPDTWAAVAIGGVYFVAVAFVALALYLGASVLLSAAILGRVPPPVARRARALRAVGVAAVSVGAAVPLSWLVLGSVYS